MTEAVVTRTASCRCGQLRAVCEGDPSRVSVCHCLACQRRTGSAFAVQARWPNDRLEVVGEATTWVRVGDDGHRITYRFCPNCGSTVAYQIEGWPGVTAIPVGAFADPAFPPPTVSVYEPRRRPWVHLEGLEGERPAAPDNAIRRGAHPP